LKQYESIECMETKLNTIAFNKVNNVKVKLV